MYTKNMKTIVRNANPLRRMKPSRAERRAFQQQREAAKGICRTESKCCNGQQLVFKWAEGKALCCGRKVNTAFYHWDGKIDWGTSPTTRRAIAGLAARPAASREGAVPRLRGPNPRAYVARVLGLHLHPGRQGA